MKWREKFENLQSFYLKNNQKLAGEWLDGRRKKAVLRIAYSTQQIYYSKKQGPQSKLDGWVYGWIDGSWVGGCKSRFRIALRTQQITTRSSS